MYGVKFPIQSPFGNMRLSQTTPSPGGVEPQGLTRIAVVQAWKRGTNSFLSGISSTRLFSSALSEPGLNSNSTLMHPSNSVVQTLFTVTAASLENPSWTAFMESAFASLTMLFSTRSPSAFRTIGPASISLSKLLIEFHRPREPTPYSRPTTLILASVAATGSNGG